MAAYIVFETGHTFGPSMLYPVYRSVGAPVCCECVIICSQSRLPCFDGQYKYDSREVFLTIYLKMVGREMGFYVPLSPTREPGPVFGWLLQPHNFSYKVSYKVSYKANYPEIYHA